VKFSKAAAKSSLAGLSSAFAWEDSAAVRSLEVAPSEGSTDSAAGAETADSNSWVVVVVSSYKIMASLLVFALLCGGFGFVYRTAGVILRLWWAHPGE